MVTSRRPDDTDGIPVDKRGGPTVDPTKNVLDLVRAESRYQDGMREQSERLLNGLREADARYQDAMREKDATLQDRLAAQRLDYEVRIANMLRTSVESTSSLVSTQLVQIQSTFNERVAKLEQFRWESGGKTSVSDPAIADAMSRLAATIVALKEAEAVSQRKMTANIEALQKSEVRADSRGAGRSDVIAWTVAGVSLLVSLIIGTVTLITFLTRHV